MTTLRRGRSVPCSLRKSMTARHLLIACLALLVFAGNSSAAGTYQLTKDGGTYIWNNYPRPGDEASWSGSKDSDGCAIGEGVLTWYKRGTFMTRYWGRMIRGKLEGLVTNEDASGKKFRGTFINGLKTGDWAPATDVPSGPAYTEGESLHDFLKRKDTEITGAYQACLASLKGSGQENLRIAQRAWIVFSNKNEAAAGLAGGRRGLTREELIREAAREVEARTEQLRSFFTLPNQDLSACQRDLDAAERGPTAMFQQALATLAHDEQEKLREAQRAWIEFREKSAGSHSGDVTGRASVWNRVVIDRRRTEELRDFYVNRLAGRAPATPPPSLYTAFDSPSPTESGAGGGPVGTTPPPAPVSVTATPPGATDGRVRERMISDFKDDAKTLLANVSGGAAGFKKFASLREITPLPAPLSESIVKTSDKAREFRSKIGFADSLRECAAETALIDGLMAYDQSLRAIHSADGPTAQTAVASFLRDHSEAPLEECKPLWESLEILSRLFAQSSKEAERHIEQARMLAKTGKTTEAIKEYEVANSTFPDPKILRTAKQLKEESLGL